MQKTKIATQVSRQNGDSTVCRKAERVDSLKAFERLILNVSSLLGFQRKIRIGRRTMREGDRQTLSCWPEQLKEDVDQFGGCI